MKFPTLLSRPPCVLLISPGILKWTDMDFGLPHLVSMGGYLLRELGEKEVRVALIDLNYEGSDQQQLSVRLAELAPFVCIGVSCYSSYDYMRTVSLARFIKHLYPHVPLLTGGYHASALPQDLVGPHLPFDAIIRGEGEMALTQCVQQLLDGKAITQPYIEGGVVENLDDLPMYRWDLLNHYWPQAHHIGRKLQIYLSRGCPYRCVFCMERSKSGYQWRAYSAPRALAELEHLSRFTDLKHWVINLADPLFALKRSWRREVLQGMIDRELFPRQYWTLTRSDDLHEEDVVLLARAHFSIGIGMESGSPRMLEIMQKGNKPDAYLQALLRLADLSRRHGLNWAGNIIVGHPGETEESMRETYEFSKQLFTSAKETCGWLSIDPFRLYPGAHIHDHMSHYEETYGSKFYHKTWWKTWYDASFKAEHIDASDTLSFEQRVRLTYKYYPSLIQEIIQRFRGQGRSIDQVFRRSLDEQVQLMSNHNRDLIIQHAQRAKTLLAQPVTQHDHKANLIQTYQNINIPMGLHLKNPQTRRREELIRQFLETGVLRSHTVIQALLSVDPTLYLSIAQVDAMLSDPYTPPPQEPEQQASICSFYGLALGLEALGACAGDVLIDALAVYPYVSMLLAHIVGDLGKVIALHPCDKDTTWFNPSLKAFKKQVKGHPIDVYPLRDMQWVNSIPSEVKDEGVNGIWIGATLPRYPKMLSDYLQMKHGRCVTWLGPKFRRPDLVCLTHHAGQYREQFIARNWAHISVGSYGWIRSTLVHA